MKNLRSHLFDAEKKRKKLPASKALITSYSLNIKGFLLSPIFISSAVVICHVNRYIMHKCCLFFYCEFQIGWDI